MKTLLNAVRHLLRSRALATQVGALLALLALWQILRNLAPMAPATSAQLLDALGGQSTSPAEGLIDSAAVLGLLLLGSFISGNISHAAGLPRLTGYLLFGCAAGPNLPQWLGLGEWALISSGQLSHLEIVGALAVSMIGLNAGGAIQLGFLKRHGRALCLLVLITCVGVQASITGIAWWLFPSAIGVDSQMGEAQVWVIAALIGILCATTSPAACIAMMRETGASGLLAQSGLTITVCSDFLCAAALSATLASAGTLLAPESALASDGLGVVWHLAGSIGVGVIAAPLLQLLGKKASTRPQTAVLVGALGLALVSTALALSPLITALSAGLVQANALPGGSRKFFSTLDSISVPVYCVFFALAGAGIDFRIIASLWPVALALVVARGALFTGVATLAARLTSLPRPIKRWIWTSLIPQAGISLALINEVQRSYPDSNWSLTLCSLMVTVVAINETIGPPLLRLGLIRCGEVDQRR